MSLEGDAVPSRLGVAIREVSLVQISMFSVSPVDCVSDSECGSVDGMLETSL